MGEIRETKRSGDEGDKGEILVTPLGKQLFTQPTANHLRRGDLIFNVDTRIFVLPDYTESSVDDDDTGVNFNTGFSWGITDKLQLTLQFQHVDSSSP